MALKTTKDLNLYFFLNKRKSTSEEDSVLILADLKYRASGHEYKIRFSTGISCIVKAFSKGTIKNTPAEPDATDKNESLLKIRKEAERIFRHHKETGKDLPLPEVYKDMIIGKVQYTEVERNFITDFQEFIQNKKALGKNYRTVNSARRTFELLSEYADYTGRKHLLRYENIDLTFYSRFVEFLRKHHNHKDNTIGKYVKKLKEFLNYSHRNGWNKYQYYKLKEFKILENDTEKVFLDDAEIQRIIQLDLTDKPTLQKIQDLFIIGVETGACYEDYKKLFNRNNLHEAKGGYDFRFNRQKSKSLCIVPASKLVLEVLAKYNFKYEGFPVYKTINESLLKLCKMAGVPKEPSTHDLRRTFITRKLIKGNEAYLVMKMTGHTTLKDFNKYVGLQEEDFSSLIRQHDSTLNIDSKDFSEILKNR